MTDRKWYRVELNREDADKLRRFLKENKIYYEASGCWNLIHFEIKLNMDELAVCNNFVENL